VADDMQRQGIGRQLMQSLMNAARDRGLEIMEGDVLHQPQDAAPLRGASVSAWCAASRIPDVMAVRRHL
jgi:acetyltransferase